MESSRPQQSWAGLRWLLDFFLFTSFFLAFCTAGMIYQAYLIFGLEINFYFLGFAFCGTLSSYNFHWYWTPDSFGGNNKAGWSVRHKGTHATLFLAALAGAVWFGLHLLAHWPLLLGTAFFTFLYSAPLIPLRVTKALQKIAVAKTLFLAITWTHVTVLMPLLMAETRWGHPEIFYLVQRLLLIYAICILFDVRDRETDRRQGIRSMITWLHPKKIPLFFWLVMLLWLVCTGALLLYGFTLPVIAALFLPGLLLALLYSYSLRHKGDYLYYFVLDGLMALSLPLLLLFTSK